MGATKKRKLALKDFGKCHPRITGRSKKCLPTSTYKELSQKLRAKGDNVFKAVGCSINEEHCLLDKAPLQDTVKKELRKQYLRPQKPKQWEKDPDMWLDNFNIANVMKQYEEAFPWFTFLGVFPIDFSAPDPYRQNGETQCLNKVLCKLNLNIEYNKGRRGIGIVFNLDPHYKGGSHWVGLYINLMNKKKPLIAYYDSYGYETPPLIAKLMRSFNLQIQDCRLEFNDRRFQYGNSECGMFSMYFIICMIHGITFKNFCKDAVKDNFMLELRSILFAK